jgi:hypothetical protein
MSMKSRALRGVRARDAEVYDAGKLYKGQEKISCSQQLKEEDMQYGVQCAINRAHHRPLPDK